MRSLRLMWVVLAAVVAPLWGAASVRAELKIGVVDVVEVSNGYTRTQEANKALQAEQAKLRQESEPKVNHIKDLQARRDLFNKGTEEWKQANEEFLKAQVEFQGWLALEQARVEQKHRDLLLDMYNQITAVVARIAKDKGLDIVFTKAFLSPPQINLDEAQGLEDLKNRIINQRVLYPTKYLDLTADVLKVLNAQYEAGKAAPPAPGKALAPAPAPTPAPAPAPAPAPKG